MKCRNLVWKSGTLHIIMIKFIHFINLVQLRSRHHFFAWLFLDNNLQWPIQLEESPLILILFQPEGEDSLKRRQLMELAIINGTYRDTKAAASVNNQLGTSVPAVRESTLWFAFLICISINQSINAVYCFVDN